MWPIKESLSRSVDNSTGIFRVFLWSLDRNTGLRVTHLGSLPRKRDDFYKHPSVPTSTLRTLPPWVWNSKLLGVEGGGRTVCSSDEKVKSVVVPRKKKRVGGTSNPSLKGQVDWGKWMFRGLSLTVHMGWVFSGRWGFQCMSVVWLPFSQSPYGSRMGGLQNDCDFSPLPPPLLINLHNHTQLISL